MSNQLLKIRKAMEAKIIEKAHQEPAFESLLLSDPHAALKEVGVPVSRKIPIDIIVEDGKSIKFVYPKAASTELSDLALSVVGAGCQTGCVPEGAGTNQAAAAA